jgi:uncharacterized membrane protein
MIWTVFANALLGIWLIVTPFTFGYRNDALICSDLISGVLLVLLSLLSRTRRRTWVTWASCAVGVWLNAAPLLFWAPQAAIYLNDTLIGVLAIVFSILIPELPEESRITIPPGWSYNPSSWPQRLPIILLALICWFISRFLAANQLHYIVNPWDPFFGLGTFHVITSNVSRAFPVSDAGLGAFAYTLEMLLACRGGEKRWCTEPWLVIVFGLLVIPAGLTSIVLIILQPLVVGAWCTLCLVTAACMLIMIALAIDEVVAALQFLNHKRKEASLWDIFWKGGISLNAKKDDRTPHMNAAWRSVFPAMVWGVNIPSNLFCCTVLGVLFMLMPWIFDVETYASDNEHVFGALTIVVAVISMAEIVRKFRYLNIVFGAWLLISTFLFSMPMKALIVQIILSILLIALSIRKGNIVETYGKYL